MTWRRLLLVALLGILVLCAAYTWLTLAWSYSEGERSGQLMKFSKKGWLCKTWEGELLVTLVPGTTNDKFLFTVRDEAVARAVTGAMDKRVSLMYEEHRGVPSSCFGDTAYFVTGVKVIGDLRLAAPVIVPPQPPEAQPR
jgi:hypothetical protein